MVLSNRTQYEETGYDYLDDYHAVQRSTGEVVTAHWAHIVDGSICYTPEQQAAHKQKKEQEQQSTFFRSKNNPLGKFYFINAEHQYKDISPQTMARLIYLGTFLSYNKSTLKSRRNTPMTKAEAKKLTGLSEATFFRFWNEVRGKYLIEDTNGYVSLSDAFIRGKIANKAKPQEYQKVYVQAVRDLYRACPVPKHKQLGRIFQMLPYINIEHNILCFTPYEANIEEIIPMTLMDFCNAIGVSPEKRTRVIRNYAGIKLPVHDHTERFCSFVFDGLHIDGANIFVNPRILYRGTNWKNVAVLGAFTTPQETVNAENITLSAPRHF